jgi:phosphatidylglycerophosphatase A
MLVTFIGVAVSWQTVIAGFLLFRFFDIVKPWPISYLDKNLDGGLGIMLDDLLSGLVACVCLHALIYWRVIG